MVTETIQTKPGSSTVKTCWASACIQGWSAAVRKSSRLDALESSVAAERLPSFEGTRQPLRESTTVVCLLRRHRRYREAWLDEFEGPRVSWFSSACSAATGASTVHKAVRHPSPERVDRRLVTAAVTAGGPEVATRPREAAVRRPAAPDRPPAAAAVERAVARRPCPPRS